MLHIFAEVELDKLAKRMTARALKERQSGGVSYSRVCGSDYLCWCYLVLSNFTLVCVFAGITLICVFKTNDEKLKIT